MRRLHLMLAAAALAVLYMAAKAPAAEQGWYLHQKSLWGGEHMIYVGSSGIRLYNKQMGVSAVSSAPDWKMILYNDKSRCYFEPPVTDKTTAARISRTLVSKIGSGMISGQPVDHYQGSSSKNIEEQSEFWTATQISLPVSFKRWLANIYKVPEIPGLPLRITYVDSSGKTVTALDTLGCQRGVIPANLFARPVGYKRVNDEVMVLMDAESKDDLANVITEFKGTGSTRSAAVNKGVQGMSNQAQQELQSVLGGKPLSAQARQAVGNAVGNRKLSPPNQQTLNSILNGQGLSQQQQQQLNSLLEMYGKR
jgi:hypothetical protein